MKKLILKIRLKSDTLIGSGEGYGAIIDSDIIFDDIGLPYIPAKRIKGCLRDSLNEVKDMFGKSEINYELITDKIFGNNETGVTANTHFSNLYIEEYENSYNWLKYLKETYQDYLSDNMITSYFTTIRQQTSIDEETGVTKEHSLRTVRVLKKDLIFTGSVDINDKNPDLEINSLVLACINLRHIGGSRTRGFGEIECNLFENNNNLKINVLKSLEALC